YFWRSNRWGGSRGRATHTPGLLTGAHSAHTTPRQCQVPDSGPLALTDGFAQPVPGRLIGGKGRLMGRGATHAKSRQAKPPVARKSPKDDGARVRDLEQQLAEARAQQAAAAEMLRVISSSLSDTQPVFDAIAESGTRLCGALAAAVVRLLGD